MLLYAVWTWITFVSGWTSDNFYKYIGHIIVILIRSNKWLLIVDGKFLSLNCQHPGNLLQRTTPTVRRSVSFPIYGSFKHNVGTKGIVKLLGSTYDGHGTKATIKNRYQDSTTFSTVSTMVSLLVSCQRYCYTVLESRRPKKLSTADMTSL